MEDFNNSRCFAACHHMKQSKCGKMYVGLKVSLLGNCITKFVHLLLLGGLMYWGKEAVPPPPYKMENQKPFSLPRLPYKYDSTNIQATAYALLTYVARQELMIDPIVKWLNSQRLTDGGWASTQVIIPFSV